MHHEELVLQSETWLGLIQDRYECGVVMDKKSKFRRCLQTLCKISKYLTQEKKNEVAKQWCQTSKSFYFHETTGNF